MGRKKKHKRTDAPARASTTAARAAADSTTPGGLRRVVRPAPLVAAAVTVMAAAVLWLFVTERPPFTRGPAPFPPPHALTTGGAEYALEDFAGAERCLSCHEREYAAWRGSTHGRAGGSPGPDLVIGRFDGTPIRFADAVVTPTVTVDGRYQFRVAATGKDTQVFTVSGVIGGGHMVGGGTQGYVSEFPDGTVRFLPFDFIRREGVWFCNTGTRTDRGWVPITPTMLLAECGDWPPVRILGTDTRYGNCQECHVAQVAVSHDTSVGRFTTRVTSLAIDCESCHGPLAEHVRRSDPSLTPPPADLSVEALDTRPKDGSLEVCFRCHAVKDVMLPGYLPGKTLENYYSLGFPQLGEGPLFADGRVRTFAYQENHRYSDCYLNGSMTCVDCHDPHGQGYRDIRGRALDGRFSDGQCTACHPSKAERPEAHSHHRPGSPGGRCVDCHMPYLQHPDVGYQLRFARSDHTIPIPRPGSDDRMGVVNACAQSGCHAGVAPARIESWMRQWYGDLKPRPALIEALLRTDSLTDVRSGLALLDTTAAHPAAQVAALGQFVARFLEPDMASLDAAAGRALRALTRAADLDLRAAALAALHLARGDDGATRTELIRALEQSRQVDAALRARWATALGTFADQYQEANHWDRAIIAYRKALEIRPGEPAILRNLGVAYASAGDHRTAVDVLRQSLDADAREPLAWLNLGVSLQHVGDTLGAEDAYRRTITINPDEPLAHFNLGNLLLRRRYLSAAVQEYELALTLQPTLTPAYEYLMLASLAEGDAARAMAAARRWQRFVPDDPRLKALLEELQAAPPSRP